MTRSIRTGIGLLVLACIGGAVWADGVPVGANADLLQAVGRGDAAAVRAALKAGADADARDAAGRAAILYAVGGRKIEVVRALLEGGAKAVNEPQTINKQTFTPLSSATWGGEAQITELLLAHGADYRLQNQDAWRGAIVSGSVPVTQLLLAAGADPNYRFEDGMSAVTIAALRAANELLAVLLDHHGNVNFRDHHGITALMYAASHGSESTVQLLLERGAAIWPLDAFGENALGAAGHNTNADTRAPVEALLKAHGIASPPKNRDIDEQLLQASYKGDLAQVKALLAQGADLEVRGLPNIKLWLRDALSASVKHPAVCRYLIERGIDVRSLDSYQFTPLHSAASDGTVECIQALVAAGADANAISKSRITPLFAAVNGSRPAAIVAALLAAGADPNGPSMSAPETVLGVAQRRGFTAIEKLLLDAGAK